MSSVPHGYRHVTHTIRHCYHYCKTWHVCFLLLYCSIYFFTIKVTSSNPLEHNHHHEGDATIQCSLGPKSTQVYAGWWEWPIDPDVDPSKGRGPLLGKKTLLQPASSSTTSDSDSMWILLFLTTPFVLIDFQRHKFTQRWKKMSKTASKSLSHSNTLTV